MAVLSSNFCPHRFGECPSGVRAVATQVLSRVGLLSEKLLNLFAHPGLSLGTFPGQFSTGELQEIHSRA
jgi:hypothetical protein